MKRNRSFSERLHSGVSKTELMQHYCITEQQFEKTVACLDRIQAAQAGK